MLQHLHDVLNFPLRHFTNIEKKVAQRLLPVFDIPTPLGTLRTLYMYWCNDSFFCVKDSIISTY